MWTDRETSRLQAIANSEYPHPHDSELLARAAVELTRLLALLREVEWKGDPVWSVCPMCQKNLRKGHTADCRLAAALAKHSGEPT